VLSKNNALHYFKKLMTAPVPSLKAFETNSAIVCKWLSFIINILQQKPFIITFCRVKLC